MGKLGKILKVHVGTAILSSFLAFHRACIQILGTHQHMLQSQSLLIRPATWLQISLQCNNVEKRDQFLLVSSVVRQNWFSLRPSVCCPESSKSRKYMGI